MDGGSPAACRHERGWDPGFGVGAVGETLIPASTLVALAHCWWLAPAPLLPRCSLSHSSSKPCAIPTHCSASCLWFCVLSPPVRVMVLALTFQSERVPRGVSRAQRPQLLKRAYANGALTLCITGHLIHNVKTQLPHTLQHHRLSTLMSTTAVTHTVHKQTKTRPHNPPQARTK